jgi:Protein of unknown function (DUF3300)
MKYASFAVLAFGLLGAVGLSAQPYPPQQQPYPPPQQQQQQPYYPPQQQQPYPQQPAYSPQGDPALLPPQQLDQLVGRIALYPDPLLAQTMTAATFSNQIPDAANWANQHASLSGDQLSQAIQEDNLPWDPSVLSLLPFPSVLNQMASDMNWTQTLGNAVLAQRNDVMDAVQRQRQVAYNYGYVQTNPYQQVIAQPGYIQIVPVNSAYIYAPYYDPYLVYARPRPGFFVGGAIRFGPAVTIGAFVPFGWRAPAFDWRAHQIVIDNRPWGRTWVNRQAYAHTYVDHRAPVAGPRVEHHEVRPVAPARQGREVTRHEERH